MKKTLALVLSLLVAFSMLAVTAAAEDELVTVEFVYQSETATETIETIHVAPGTSIIPDMVPEIVREFMTEKENEDGKTVKTKYIFKGWRSSVDGGVHYDSGIPTPTAEQAGTTITYTAEYATEDYSERQSFWNFIESIFERLNLLFEYFATVFNW